MTPNVDDLDKKESSSNRRNDSYVYSFVQTPPPGFTLDKINTNSSFDGNNRTGAGSAPPRSFVTDEFMAVKKTSSQCYQFNGHDQLRIMLRPNDENGRSTSFVNLAAALGEGLAESIGDSLKDIHQEQSDFSK
jgi:hypothetical protein